ncbi:MAG: PilZ domain-containing protein [Elusimicrobia bacterium]|nr:PilZ domain-containing protein [Elusimicrobiota bacterium]
MGQPEDRRKHPRRASNAPLVLLHRTGRDSLDGAVLRDVSMSGLAFETDLPLTTGEEFDFALHVPGKGWVDGTGRVCWLRQSGGTRLCGASITIREWNQERLLAKWLHPTGQGLLRFFFPGTGVTPPEA